MPARASLDPGFAQENWGFLAQPCVENLLQAPIVLADQQPPLSLDLTRLQLLALICQLRDGLEARLSAPG
jgi:hypothetical protein